MFITEFKPKKKFVRVTDKDREWAQTDGLAVYTRAALEISPDCPSSHAWIIQHAINTGWLKQIAYVEAVSYTHLTLRTKAEV